VSSIAESCVRRVGRVKRIAVSDQGYWLRGHQCVAGLIVQVRSSRMLIRCQNLLSQISAVTSIGALVVETKPVCA
jgi:hypothetical protein